MEVASQEVDQVSWFNSTKDYDQEIKYGSEI